MNGKKIIAWILTFCMIIQIPGIPLNMEIQSEVEAAENTHTEEEGKE